MRRAVVILTLTGALAVACGSPSTGGASSPSPSAAAAVPGVDAEVVRLRTDEAIGGQVQVRITDTDDAGFTVTAVALDTPGFTPVPAQPVTAEFAPGRTIDLPTPYGTPICTAAPLPAAAQVTLVRPDGAVEQLRIPLSAEILGRIHEEECAVAALAEVAAISVTALRAEEAAVTGTITLTRRGGDESVTATRLGRSVLLDARAEGLPLALAGDERTASTPVTFTPATCDPHVLSETKKPYVFPLAVRVGDGGEVPVDLPLDQGARDLLAALVQRVCAPPG